MIQHRILHRLILGVAMLLLVPGIIQAFAESESSSYVSVTHSASTTQTTGIPVFGYETYTNYLNNEAVRQQAETLGGSWVRLNTPSWRDLQSSEDTAVEDWHWEKLAAFERELEVANDLGLTPMVIADDFPDWAVKPYVNPYTNQEELVPCAALQEEYFDEYAVYLRELVKRYKDPPYNVKYWELGNEVDVDPRLMSRELQDLFGCWGHIEDEYYGGRHYGNMLQVVYPVIKDADPEAQVIIGGLLLDRANTNIQGRGKPERFLEGILEAGAGDSFDFVAFHSYPWYSWENGRTEDVDLTDYRWSKWGGMTIGKVRYLRSIMEQYEVDKPLFLNEAALLFWGGTASDEFLQTQADHLVRVLLRAMSEDVQMYSWYTLHKSGWNESGLLNADDSIRPAYRAYQHLIEKTSQLGMPEATSDYGEAIEAYRFRQGQDVLDIFWSRDATRDNVEIAKVAFLEAFTRNGAAFMPEETATRFLIPTWVEPVYVHRKPQSSSPAPVVSAVEPSSMQNTAQVEIVLEGEHFAAGDNVWLERVVSEGARSYQLEQVSFVGADQLKATVPAMLPPGSYDVVVENSDGWVGALANGVTIKAFSPKIDDIRPHIGRADLPNTVHVYGSHFAQDITVHLGEEALPAESVSVINDGHLRVTLPPTSTEKTMQYPLKVVNPDTTSDTMREAFTLLAPTDVDLYGYRYQLWTDPIMPHVNEEVRVGLVVYQAGENVTNRSTKVRFSLDDGEDGSNQLGEPALTLPETSGAVHSPDVGWTQLVSGVQKVCASIDEEDAIAEVSESNNRICREVQVLSPALDQQAPLIERLTINNSEETSTNQTEVTLQVEATDTITDGSLVSTEGVAGLLFQEYEYSFGNGQWVPVQWSEWITDTERTSFSWQLLPFAGKKYIQVWAVDHAGNISLPASAAVTYTTDGSEPPEDPPGEPSSRTIPPKKPPLALMPEGGMQKLYLPVVQR